MFELFRKKFSFKLSVSLLFLLASLIWLTIFSLPDKELHLIFCDVGQGDAILITRGSDQILIDGGPNQSVLSCLADHLPYYDRQIEIVILTHPESDHLTGLLSVFDNYQVQTFVSGPEGNNSAVFRALEEKINQQKQNSLLEVKNIYTGESIKLGEILLQSLWPERNFISQKLSNIAENSQPIDLSSHVLGMRTGNLNLNQFSLVFLLKFKNYSVLLMGDADEKVQDDILFYNSLMPLDILKFAHHGSKTGMSEEFIKVIRPKEAVISVGKNSYGHPSTEALELLDKYKIKTRRTDLEGEIEYVF